MTSERGKMTDLQEMNEWYVAQNDELTAQVRTLTAENAELRREAHDYWEQMEGWKHGSLTMEAENAELRREIERLKGTDLSDGHEAVERLKGEDEKRTLRIIG